MLKKIKMILLFAVIIGSNLACLFGSAAPVSTAQQSAQTASTHLELMLATPLDKEINELNKQLAQPKITLNDIRTINSRLYSLISDRLKLLMEARRSNDLEKRSFDFAIEADTENILCALFWEQYVGHIIAITDLLAKKEYEKAWQHDAQATYLLQARHAHLIKNNSRTTQAFLPRILHEVTQHEELRMYILAHFYTPTKDHNLLDECIGKLKKISSSLKPYDILEKNELQLVLNILLVLKKKAVMVDKFGLLVLRCAASYASPEALPIIATFFHDSINEYDAQGTPLHCAIEENNASAVGEFLAMGASIEQELQSNNGTISPLELAMEKANIHIVNHIMDRYTRLIESRKAKNIDCASLYTMYEKAMNVAKKKHPGNAALANALGFPLAKLVPAHIALQAAFQKLNAEKVYSLGTATRSNPPVSARKKEREEKAAAKERDQILAKQRNREKLQAARLRANQAEIAAQNSRQAAEQADAEKRETELMAREDGMIQKHKEEVVLQPNLEPNVVAAQQTEEEIQADIAAKNAAARAQKKIDKSTAKKARRKAARYADDTDDTPSPVHPEVASPAASTVTPIIHEDKTMLHGNKKLIPLRNAPLTLVHQIAAPIAQQPVPLVQNIEAINKACATPSPNAAHVQQPIPAVAKQADESVREKNDIDQFFSLIEQDETAELTAVIAKILKTSPAFFGTPGATGKTVLMLCAGLAHEKPFELIMRHSKAVLDSKDSDGRTALDYAKQAENNGAIRALSGTMNYGRAQVDPILYGRCKLIAHQPDIVKNAKEKAGEAPQSKLGLIKLIGDYLALDSTIKKG